MPAFARVPLHALEAIREGLAEDDEEARSQLDEGFERFEEEQPALASYVADALNEPLDETALALGYFLSLAVWMAFEHAHGEDIREVDESEVATTDELLALDEELRKTDPVEALDSDDVVALQQPHLVAFIHEHLDATLESHADSVDVDDVHTVYRVVLVELLALSYGVERPAGYPVANSELLA